jgi:putative endonuclease
MPYMYLLECRGGSYYTGSTIDLRKRIVEHQNGTGAKYTRSKLPVKLVYCEEYPQVDVAFRREKQVQKWSHEKKKALVEGSEKHLRSLAACRNVTHFSNTPLKKQKSNSRGHLDSAR